MTRGISGWLGSCEGSVAVEAAMVLPIFLAFVFGIIEVSRACWIQSSLQFAVEDAARCASVNATTCGSTGDIQSYAASKVPGLTIASSSFTVTKPGCGNKVAIDYAFTSLAGSLVPLSVTLRAESCHV